MRRKITVYGLRFYETTFWNRLNTGFLEPAVATALTACGMRRRALTEKRSDDEVRTSLVPDRRDGKTKRIE